MGIGRDLCGGRRKEEARERRYRRAKEDYEASSECGGSRRKERKEDIDSVHFAAWLSVLVLKR